MKEQQVRSLFLRGRREGDTESKKKKPAKVPFIEATVVERGPEREQEGSKIRQWIDYYIQY